MGFGISLPSLSDIGHAVRNGVTGAATSVRDFGSAAVAKTEQLASDGLDLGRGAVNAVESIDVRQAASVVREKISEGTEAAQPFYPNLKPIDAYAAAILDTVETT